MMADSVFDWWALAGVESLVGEVPSGWLAAPAVSDTKAKKPRALVADVSSAPLPAALQRQTVESAPVAAGPVIFPDDWDGFHAWLADHPDVPGGQWDAQRILPVGVAGAPLMVFTAWPDVDDLRDGHLFAGDNGKLLDAMLAAIGIDRSDCYCASLAVTRPPGGRCDSDVMADLDRLLWHHLRLAAPQRLLLVGGDITRMAGGVALPDARGKLLNINHDIGTIETVAVANPATLLARPAQKAAAWDSLKLFNRGR